MFYLMYTAYTALLLLFMNKVGIPLLFRAIYYNDKPTMRKMKLFSMAPTALYIVGACCGLIVVESLRLLMFGVHI